MPATLPDEVRAHCAAVTADATAVRIDDAALERVAGGEWAVADPGLDARSHLLEGDAEDIARAMLIADAVNFGSGWFPTLRKRVDHATGRPVSGSITIAWGLSDHHRAHGVWTADELRATRADALAALLGQAGDHELMSLYAQALRALGVFLGGRSALEVVAAADGSAAALARQLADGMALYADHGFYKRAQITANDLALAGVARFRDLDDLTIFADNLVPHVLRCEGVLVYDEALAAHIDAGRTLPFGRRWEREIRACAVTACERLAPQLGVPARVLDTWLWNRGQDPEMKARPRHRCRCVFY
ncbi:hypothetical protein DSM112329_02340 [Paraconexibacter sp. AEG42_29]|uniref:Queuosine 5'-phosphate N-glycosylase/hydrolase n=1 Tax=Paraconexibacter sp. AEG42_29 TaxID=2997339 RepID=A0AAU7AV68_9ACTN